MVEGFLFAVEKLRQTTGINFGAVAIDDCYSALRGTRVLSDFFYDITSSGKLQCILFVNLEYVK